MPHQPQSATSTGWWFAAYAGPAGVQWSLFWSGLAATVGVVLVCFLTAYCRRGVHERAGQQLMRGEN
jgi:L-lactate utilization protein LutB